MWSLSLPSHSAPGRTLAVSKFQLHSSQSLHGNGAGFACSYHRHSSKPGFTVVIQKNTFIEG